MIKELYLSSFRTFRNLLWRDCKSEIANKNQYETKTKSVKVIFYFHLLQFCSIHSNFIGYHRKETGKVQIFWEVQKNLAHLPLFFWHYLVASNYKWKMGQIFVAFSEYLNFRRNTTIYLYFGYPRWYLL